MINFEVNHMFDSSVNHEENNGGMSYETLIPVRMGEIGGEAVQLCNARDLHICLGAGSRFNDWIARRIAEYGFADGQDFYSEMSKKAAGRKGRGSVEYSISVDMAKELAMVERTEAGRRIRRYFIACEKALRQIAPEVAADCLRKALNPQQQFQLKEKVDSKVACLAKARQRAGYHEIWSNLKSRHQVAQYRDIPQGEFEDACKYVESYVWDGEWIEGRRGSASEIEFSCSIEDWIARNPQCFGVTKRRGGDLGVTVGDLVLSKDSPCLELLDKMHNAGYQVEGAFYEFRSYQNLMRQMDYLMKAAGGAISQALGTLERGRIKPQEYAGVQAVAA
ncbi:antA/AntB antirepressor family protein [Stutzerimonas stutzeri]|uniref:antA/AntB antirepressor family protein n=1 Tax=Stutzerimonas stutzeri TaxID=316 RepID=UPI002446C373|nr:antA/AntB antirepressor family protein [Stutzerimonas stutzeri]MDH0157363.1 antA/AntB antirepressor family protein [Stutzerimonas stutzeri]